MIRWIAWTVGLGMVSMALAGDPPPAVKSVTWTGWFSDLKCASARAAGGLFTATNPECAR